MTGMAYLSNLIGLWRPIIFSYGNDSNTRKLFIVYDMRFISVILYNILLQRKYAWPCWERLKNGQINQVYYMKSGLRKSVLKMKKGGIWGFLTCHLDYLLFEKENP